MLTLGQAVAQHGAQGASIETPYDALNRLGFTLRRGQVSMIAAGPGVGKSMVAQDLVMRITAFQHLYISADTDSFTVAVRAAAKMSGHDQTQVEKGLNEPTMAPMYRELLAKMWNVRWSFDCSTMEDVRDEVYAYATAYGEYPSGLIVIDNLANIVGDDDYRGMRDAMTNMQVLARKTGAHVMVLHHATGRYEDGATPIPLSGLENKVGKFPAQVLTLTREGARLGLFVVKNRGGKADARANYGGALYVDLARMQFNG